MGAAGSARVRGRWRDEVLGDWSARAYLLPEEKRVVVEAASPMGTCSFLVRSFCRVMGLRTDACVSGLGAWIWWMLCGRSRMVLRGGLRPYAEIAWALLPRRYYHRTANTPPAAQPSAALRGAAAGEEEDLLLSKENTKLENSIKTEPRGVGGEVKTFELVCRSWLSVQ